MEYALTRTRKDHPKTWSRTQMPLQILGFAARTNLAKYLFLFGYCSEEPVHGTQANCETWVALILLCVTLDLTCNVIHN